ncbi:peroxisomal adenine nucleotide transporter 1 [Colletotrichum asianum]
MVYCGKASQGCQNCRTRRIKCDKVKPECSQCIRVGKKCPGYRDQLSLMFRDESKKVIKKAHAQWGVPEGSENENGSTILSTSTAPTPPSSSPAYSRKSTPTSGGNTSRSGKASASPVSASVSPSSSHHSPGSVSPMVLPIVKQEPVRETSPLTIRVGPTLEEQGLQFYVNRYLVGHPDEVKSASDLASEPWVWHPALQDVMCAVGLAGLHNLTGNIEMMSMAREKYGSALRQTGKLIRPPHTPSIDVTMRVVVALAMFEVVKGTHHSTGTVHAHVMGGAALMRSWCPMPSVPFGGFRALLQLCYSMFIPLHVAGMPMPPDFYDWVSYGSQLQMPFDLPSTDLAVLIARFVEISSFINNHVVSDGKPKTANVIQQLLELDADLSAWEAGLKGEWEYRVVHATHLPPKAVFQGEYHKYHDVWTARIWNYYRWARILVNQTLLDLANQNPVSNDEQTIKVASKKDTKNQSNGPIKLKKPAPKYSKPGNWREGSVIDDDKKSKNSESASISVASPGPVVNPLDDNAREAFATGRPLEDSPDLQQCKHCKKSILKTAAKAHIAQCLRLKKEKAQRKKEAREARERAKEAAREEEARKADEDGDGKGEDDSDGDDDGAEKKATGNKTAKKAAGKKTDGEAGKGKKRKADGDADKGPKQKKKKEEPKPKAPKPKGPVDVERQCGVLLPNGQPCARSLTCKSHSMGAKRAVAGRSLPYDMLLAAYQKKNQAKQQKAALDANAPLEDEDEANAGPVDSDEETAAVMSALAHWNPQPVVPQPVLNPIKRQYQLARLHEQLQMATNGGRTNIFKVLLVNLRIPPSAVPPTTMPAGVLEAFGHALAGATGTAFSTAAVYPLDLVTTRLKVQRQLRREDSISKKEQYRGVLDALKTVVTQEGVSALYTGLAQDIFKSVTDSFLFFLFYAYFKDTRRRARGSKLPAIEQLLVGALAGACARACTTPMANVVTRKQTSAMMEDQDDEHTLSIWRIMAAIRAENGIRGLWAGYSASLLLTINPSITFFLNDKLAKTLQPDSDEASYNTQTTFLFAAASKAIATTISYPLQTAKTRLQIRGSGSPSPRRSTDTAGSTFEKDPQRPASFGSNENRRSKLERMAEYSVLALVISIARAEGITALYAGLQGEVLKSFFSHGLTMVSKGIIHKLVLRFGIFIVIFLRSKSPAARSQMQRLRQMVLRLL